MKLIAGKKLAGIQTFSVDRSMEVLFKVGGYAAIGGYTLEISQLITLISMSILFVSFVLIIAHRRLLLFVRRIGEAQPSKMKKREN